MEHLVALCGKREYLQLKQVPLHDSLQNSVFEMFKRQDELFKTDCFEREFNKSWKPEDNEISTVTVPSNTDLFDRIFECIPTNTYTVDVATDSIKALAFVEHREGAKRVLLQKFTKAQVLRRKRTLLLHGKTFTSIEKDAFQLGDRLVAIVEDGLLKFKNLNNLRGFLDTSDIFREATNDEVSTFLKYSLFDETKEEEFFRLADSVIRTKILILLEKSVLEKLDVNSVVGLANDIGFELGVRNDAIVLPTEKASLKHLLKFLCDELYLGSFSKILLMSNSSRPFKKPYKPR